ncbi:MAG: sel1 repeat family protein [Alphaproteobacteria bacterium]|nr:sel1 repeat family protein [Alphaproteobacteria bacterium]
MDDRQIARNGDLRATIGAHSDKCQGTVDIKVHAPNESSFQGNRIAFQKLLAVVRMALLSNCKKIKNIRITGKVNNNTVYYAYINAENKWYLIDNHTKKQDMKKLPASLKGLDQLNGLSTDPKHNNLSLEEATNQGDVNTQYGLGVMYYMGWGVSKDHTKAIKWFRLNRKQIEQQANQGNANAQYNLGFMYHMGQGVPQDYTKAVKWYQKAANQGHANAQYELSGMYDGDEYSAGLGGVPQDLDKAVKLIQKAANQGLARAQYKLSLMYYHGFYMSSTVLLSWQKDYTKAIKWAQKAANQGNAEAQDLLYTMYNRGYGVPQDYAEVTKEFRKAAAQQEADEERAFIQGVESFRKNRQKHVDPLPALLAVAGSTMLAAKVLDNAFDNNSSQYIVENDISREKEVPSRGENILVDHKESDLLGNPDGYYTVTKTGISQIKVDEKTEDGNYLLNKYVVKFKGSSTVQNNSQINRVQKGQLASKGWWFPSYQQFRTTKYAAFPNRTECSGFLSETKSWSSPLVKKNNIPVTGGRTIAGYEYSGKSPLNRQPNTDSCAAIGADKYCNIHCTHWFTAEEQQQKGYLVSKRSDAFDLYSYLNSQ